MLLFVLRGGGWCKERTDLGEPLHVLRERPHAAPVVVVEELDHGRVDCVVRGHCAEEVGVLFLVRQHRGGRREGQLKITKRYTLNFQSFRCIVNIFRVEESSAGSVSVLMRLSKLGHILQY